MSKLWLVALYEYRRRVFQKSFVLMLFSLPLMIALMLGLGAFSSSMSENAAAIGYVDHAGLLADAVPAPQRAGSPNEPGVARLVPLTPFQTEEEARKALAAKEIQAYYVVSPDYFETNRVELVYIEPPGNSAGRQFWDFMQINRLADLPPEVARRAVTDSNLIVYWPDDAPGGGREFSGRTFLNNFLPLFAGFAFVMLLFMNSGYLMSAVAEEKENRTMEILVTSVSPAQIIGGKVAGILAIVLTQVVGWTVFSVLGVWIGGRCLGIGMLQNLSVDLGLVLKMAVVAAPAFVLVAALMTALGATVAEAQEAQQASAFFALPVMIPFWFIQLILENPDSPLTIGLSFFPITALPTISMRLAFAQVPSWQIGVSAALATLSALGAVWLAGRAFRLGMLRYGQRLDWRDFWRVKRER
jgi:ABC-2 type transport system permease protein